MRKLALAAVVAAVTIGMAACADPNAPLVPAAAVVRAQEMNAAQVEDAQLTAKTARAASEWQTQQEAAAELAAQQAAEAAAAAAAQAAAEEAARQAAAAETANDDSGSDSGASGPTTCPAGTTANAVDAAGNESNCLPNNPVSDQPCVAYDASNNCTAWLDP